MNVRESSDLGLRDRPDWRDRQQTSDRLVEHDRLQRDRRARRRGFAAGLLASIALGLLACATGGSRAGGGDQAAPKQEETAAPSSPDAPVAPAIAPAPAEPPSSAAPASPVAPATTDAPPAQAAAPAAAGDSPVAGYLADPQAMVRASQLFRAVCTGYCHSTQPTADRVAPNLFDCEWDHGPGDQEIFQSIAAGIPETQMQGFGERLPHEDLWKLVAYMRQKSTCK